MKRITKILGLSLILAILILGSFPQALTLAQNPQPSSKVSSLLLHVGRWPPVSGIARAAQ